MEDEHDRPWERAGQCRRDAVPHRGRLLARLGTACIILAHLGVCVFPCAVLSVCLGGLIFYLAWRDEGAMQRGEMDPNGRRFVRWAKEDASVGVGCGGFVLLVFAAVILWAVGWGL